MRAAEIRITILKNQLSFFLKICYLSNDIFHGKPTSFVAVYELKTKVLCVVQMMQNARHILHWEKQEQILSIHASATDNH